MTAFIGTSIKYANLCPGVLFASRRGHGSSKPTSLILQYLKGIKVHPDNPFRFDFILIKVIVNYLTTPLKDESSKLIKYFLASLTIPEKDLWVNLSLTKKTALFLKAFGLTEMGRDLLAEDYMLKQITASL